MIIPANPLASVIRLCAVVVRAAGAMDEGAGSLGAEALRSLAMDAKNASDDVARRIQHLESEVACLREQLTRVELDDARR